MTATHSPAPSTAHRHRPRGVVLRRLVRDHRRGILGWAAGIAGIVLFVAVFFPSFSGSTEFERAIESMPDALKALAGMVGDLSYTSPPGYLHSQLLSNMLPLLLIVLAIGLGSRETAGAEEAGTLEWLLTAPVSRRRVWVERALGMTALVMLQAVVAFVATVAIGPAFGLLDGVSLVDLLLACLAAGLVAVVHGAVAFAVGAMTGRRSPAITAAVVVAAVGYLAEGLSSLSGAAETVARVLPWHWYLDRVVVVDGLSAASVLLPVGVASVLVVAGGLVFERRDLR